MIMQVTRLPDLPVLLREIGADYKAYGPNSSFYEEDIALLDSESLPIYYVIDLRHFKISVNDMFDAARNTPEQLQLMRHRNIIQTLLITQNRMMELAARGMNSPMFGNIALKPFPTVEAALDYVRQQTTNK
jgi:hypothetical protein